MKKVFYIYLLFLLFLTYGFFAYWGSIRMDSWRLRTADLYIEKGEESLKSNNSEQALLDFKKAESLKPFSQDIQLKIGDIYYSRKLFDEARNYYLNTKSFQGYAKLAACYLEEKNFDQSIIFALKSLEIEKNKEGYYVLGMAYIEQERLDEAKKVFKELVLLDERDEKSHYYNSLILAVDNTELAEKELKTSLGQESQEFLKALAELKKFTNPYYQKVYLANFYIEKKIFGLSLSLLKQDNQEKPDYRDAYFLLGKTYFLNEDYEKAKEAFNKVIALDPIYKEGYLFLAETYKKLGNSEESERNLQKANDLEL